VERVHPVAAAGFGAAADLYERARPSYPPEAVDWIVERTGLGPGRTVVDLGAGTGKLTRLLVASGACVVAVEPVAEMRAKLEQVVPGIRALDGTAESIPLPDGAANAITVAQAFHWFDRERAYPELHRVLAPGSFLVLLWNTRDLADPLQSALEELLAPLRGTMQWQQSVEWQPEVESSPLFGPIEHRTFVLEQHLTVDGLVDRVGSTSFVATLPEAERAALLDRVRGLGAGVDEPFAFRYRTDAFAIPRGVGLSDDAHTAIEG
jgi:SAM-dependent methyltransferase